MSSPQPTPIDLLHAAYVRLTGLDIRLDLAGYRASLWHTWAHQGWGEPELAIVIKFIQRCIRNNDRGFNAGSLRFNRLIGQIDTFEELLAEARATGRPAPSTNPARDSILRATGRPTPGQGSTAARPAGQIAHALTRDPAAAAAALADFQKMKTNL